MYLKRKKMVLSDKSIKDQIERQRIVVSPLDPEDIQPASIDLQLDRQILKFTNSRQAFIDVKESLDDLTEIIAVSYTHLTLPTNREV